MSFQNTDFVFYCLCGYRFFTLTLFCNFLNNGFAFIVNHRFSWAFHFVMMTIEKRVLSLLQTHLLFKLSFLPGFCGMQGRV